MATEVKRKTKPYDEMLIEIIKDRQIKEKVQKIYAKEREKGIRGCESFKNRCVEAATKMREEIKRKERKDKKIVNNDLRDMRRVQQ